MGIVAGRNGHGSTLFPKSAVLGTFGFDIYAAYQCGVPVGGRAVLFARMARRPWNHMGMGTWATTTTSPRGAVGDRRPAAPAMRRATCEGGRSCQCESRGGAGCGPREVRTAKPRREYWGQLLSPIETRDLPTTVINGGFRARPPPGCGGLVAGAECATVGTFGFFSGAHF